MLGRQRYGFERTVPVDVTELDSFGRPHGPSAKCLESAHPTEYLLTLGGDGRLRVDPETGLNQYGCSPMPRPDAITFSSSTASSVSPMAYQAADNLRRRLLRESKERGPGQGCRGLAEAARARLSALLQLGDVEGAEIVFTPSGTDGELYALHIARASAGSGLVNIVIAPTEIGSGTVAACGGRHFADETPLAGAVERGTPIDGFPCDHVEVASVSIRSSFGQPLSSGYMKKRIRAILERAATNHQGVLLHLLDSSKTGLLAPTLEAVGCIRNHAPVPVEVVVDAAQMRLSTAMIRRYLHEECMVLITGSKFYTGPPFAGALLVPPRLSAGVDTYKELRTPRCEVRRRG